MKADGDPRSFVFLSSPFCPLCFWMFALRLLLTSQASMAYASDYYVNTLSRSDVTVAALVSPRLDALSGNAGLALGSCRTDRWMRTLRDFDREFTKALPVVAPTWCSAGVTAAPHARMPTSTCVSRAREPSARNPKTPLPACAIYCARKRLPPGFSTHEHVFRIGPKSAMNAPLSLWFLAACDDVAPRSFRRAKAYENTRSDLPARRRRGYRNCFVPSPCCRPYVSERIEGPVRHRGRTKHLERSGGKTRQLRQRRAPVGNVMVRPGSPVWTHNSAMRSRTLEWSFRWFVLWRFEFTFWSTRLGC